MDVLLYWGSGSMPSRRVQLALAVKGVPYEGKLLSFSAGETRTPEFKKLNVRGKVPTIVADGFVLSESLAILAWLDAKLSLYEAAPLEAGLDLGLGAHLLQAEGQAEPPLRSRSDGVWGLLGSLGAHARLDLTAATALGLSVRALGVLPRQGIALSSDRVELSQPLLSASAGVIVGL